MMREMASGTQSRLILKMSQQLLSSLWAAQCKGTRSTVDRQ